MQIIPIKSDFINEDEDLFNVLLRTGFSLKNGDILAVASKAFSYSEGRIVDCETDECFRKLVKKEAEKYFQGEWVDLTKKHGVWVANSGLDRSNVRRDKVALWPKAPQKSVDNLYHAVKEYFRLTESGIIMVDSVCHIARKGVIGICLAYRGFVGVVDEMGKPDFFGNPVRLTRIALADGLAAAANLVMGERGECVPFCIIKDAPVDFTDQTVDSISEMSMEDEKCIFNPLFND